MRDIYDILVNFKRHTYEFYEWTNKDNIENIKIMPCIKANDDMIKDIYYNDVKIDINLLKKIYLKTEVFYNRAIKKIEYACIFYNNELAIATELDKDGIVIGKSRLLLDEEQELLKEGLYDMANNIIYDVIKENKANEIYTRKEYQMIFAFNKYLDMAKHKEDEIKYLYLECFGKEEQDITKAYSKLIYHVNNADLEVLNKLKNLIKVIKI